MNQVVGSTVSEQFVYRQPIHTFLLRPFCSSAVMKSEVQVEFSPLSDSQGKSISIVPIFNQDRNPNTPAFSLFLSQEPTESSSVTSNFTQQKRENSSNSDRDVILQPKPSHNYCYVCKEVYQDYLKVRLSQQKHIEHKVHKKNLEASPFTKEITSMVIDFQLKRQRPERRQQPRKREFQYQSQPNKKRIIQNSFTYQPISIKISKESMESTNCGYNFSKSEK